MQRGHFFKSSLMKDIGAFRLAGYFTWNEEAAGSNPVSYTRWAVMFQGWRETFAMLLEGFDSLTVHIKGSLV